MLAVKKAHLFQSKILRISSSEQLSPDQYEFNYRVPDFNFDAQMFEEGSIHSASNKKSVQDKNRFIYTCKKKIKDQYKIIKKA